MMNSFLTLTDVKEVADFVRGKIVTPPEIAIILGSGLSLITKDVEEAVTITYKEIPGYPQPTVKGHTGEFISGEIGNVPVLFASGRFHYYEGHNIETLTLSIRLFHALGTRNLIITNAAGSVRRSSPPGTLMAISGHMDCTFRDGPLQPEIFRNEKYHDTVLLKLALNSAKRLNVKLAEGVYVWTLGPSFETPAEIRMIREFGGDAVGMSTVPEIQAAGELGLRVLGISCLTNYAAGITDKPLTHEEVMETTAEVGKDFTRLVKEIITAIGKE